MKSIVLILLYCTATYGRLRLNRLSGIKFPYNANNDFGFRRSAVNHAAYHNRDSRLYVLGGQTGPADRLLHVVSLSDPANPTIDLTYSIPASNYGPANYVAACNDYIAVSLDNSLAVHEGFVLIFSPYNEVTGTLEMAYSKQTVGFNPKGMAFTSDCKKLIVANEGRFGDSGNSQYIDTAGSVTSIHLNGGGIADINTNTFQTYVEGKTEQVLLDNGIRWVHRYSNNPPENPHMWDDFEPEAVAINEANTRAYVSMPTNNAIAEIDITQLEISVMSITSLGFKTWHTHGFDGSDVDGGPRFIEPHIIQSMYQPTDIAIGKLGDEEFLFTANQGKIRTLPAEFNFNEAQSAGQIYRDDDFHNDVVNVFNQGQLGNDSAFGRLMVRSVDSRGGPYQNQGKVIHVTTYGARSISQWHLSNMRLQFDSAEKLEKYESQYYPQTFNGESNDSTKTPAEQRDLRSILHGPEPTSVALGYINTMPFGIVGTATGTLHLYSYEGAIQFENITRGGDTDNSWNNLYSSDKTGDADISSIGTIITTSRTYVYVIGRASGTCSIYEVLQTLTR